MAIISSTLARIKSDPLACLGGAERVNQLFAEAGHRWRKCRWDPAATMGMFILQVLHQNTAMTALRFLSDVDVKDSTYCDARMRLPVEAVAKVVERLCGDCCRCIQETGSWLGRRVFVADATSATAPDEPVLQDLWPQPSAQKTGCGFPVVKRLGLLDLATGMIVQLTMMCLNVHEMNQPASLLAMLKAGDVLLADRGFCSFMNVAILLKSSVDAVFRMHQKQIVDFTPNRPHRAQGKKVPRARDTELALCPAVGSRGSDCRMGQAPKTGMDERSGVRPDAGMGESQGTALSHREARLRSQCTPPGQKQLIAIDLVVNPVRPGRWHPRVLKRRMKEYDLMNKPRSQYAQPVPEQEVAN